MTIFTPTVIVDIEQVKELSVMIIQIDPASTTPIYEQLYNQIVLGIASGKLEPGEVLPSVRSLGVDLGINFHTVNKSYTMLCDDGYIILNRRQGAVVAHGILARESFEAKLSEDIMLGAAKAICKGVSREEFIDICERCFEKATEGEV